MALLLLQYQHERDSVSDNVVMNDAMTRWPTCQL